MIRWGGALLLALAASSAAADETVERGEYLTNILGCGGCHTEGALLGDAHGEWLAGAKVGVAYTPEDEGSPGVVFPANLTGDLATGLGAWRAEDIVRFLKTGMDHYGKTANPVMPWPNYAMLHDKDLEAIAAFLKTMPGVRYEIPEPIAPGGALTHSFVRIGVYLFVPEEAAGSEQAEEGAEDD